MIPLYPAAGKRVVAFTLIQLAITCQLGNTLVLYVRFCKLGFFMFRSRGTGVHLFALGPYWGFAQVGQFTGGITCVIDREINENISSWQFGKEVAEFIKIYNRLRKHSRTHRASEWVHGGGIQSNQ